MSVDLADFVEELKIQVNPPGVDLFPGTTDPEWLRRLVAGFWDGRLQGLTALKGYTVDAAGVVTAQDSRAPDMPRELVQLVVNAATNLKTQFKAQAGPVSYEQQQSATVMRDILAAVKEEKAIILGRLGDEGVISPYVVDLVQQADNALTQGFTSWVSAGVDRHSRGSGYGNGMGP
jgi:hypothetical protein